MSDQAIKDALEAATRDEAATRLRQDFGAALAAVLCAGGKALWIGGSMIGPDRAEGNSPFEFGSDATVGLATVLQIGGELLGGAITLFDAENRYAAAALTRQLVEVEYLAWAFAEDHVEAERWMRSSKEERQEMWQPRHVRERSDGRFRGVDYGLHCGKGGHPSPEGLHLLPDHFAPEASTQLLFCDMAIHGHSVWCYALSAAGKLGYGDTLTQLEEARAVAQTEERWRGGDPFVAMLQRLGPPRAPLAETLMGLRRERESKGQRAAS